MDADAPPDGFDRSERKVTPRDRTTKARLNLVAVRGEVGNLEEMIPEWDDLYPNEQTDFEIEWSNSMAHLRSLERLYSAGELTEELEREYAPVRARVGELMPTIRRLGLAEPGFPIG